MTDGTSHLHIDRTSAESPHAQLQRQLADGVADGTLRPGTRLPRSGRWPRSWGSPPTRWPR